jgi:hypothetical protein
MTGITKSKLITALAVLILIMSSSSSFARVNSLTGGLSLGLDYDDRSYDDREDDDYQSIVLTPMVLFRSLSERDSFELRAAPGIRYDLIDSETDWDSNISVAADRFMTQFWQLGILNHYLISDYYDTETGIISDPADPSQEVAPSTDPQLSSNRGRSRYWRNTLGLFSSYFYREDSLFRLDLNYIALRNDDTSFGSDEDYDRYTGSLRNEHRFNAKWQSTLDFRYVRGDFEPTDPAVGVAPTEDPLSDDLNEYHLLLLLDNQSIALNPLSLSYNYIGTRYDETLQDDSDIHQMRLTWRRDISSRMYTNLGIGPSYVKTEGRDAEWGGNGIAEVNYAVEHGFFNFLVEKTYDVDNFSGSDESGLVDSWETRLSGSYQLQRDLTLSGRASYFYEDREGPLAVPGGGGLTRLEEYHNDRYIAGATLSHTFWQFYTASIDYTFTTLDSDRVGDSYDDHRILLTLSWEKELFHW